MEIMYCTHILRLVSYFSVLTLSVRAWRVLRKIRMTLYGKNTVRNFKISTETQCVYSKNISAPIERGYNLNTYYLEVKLRDLVEAETMD